MKAPILSIVAIPAVISLSSLTGAAPLPAKAQGLNPVALERIKKAAPRLPFTFAFTGDSRNTPAFTAITGKLAADKRLSFVIIGGDMVDAPQKTAFAAFVRRVGGLDIPVLTLPGNHDVNREDKSLYQSIFGPPYYAFTVAGTRFILLDDSDGKGLGPTQQAWLERQLKDKKKIRHRLVFMHVPPWDPGAAGTGGHCLNPDAARDLTDLLRRYRVDLVFASHIHAFYQDSRHGLKMIVSGGAGARLYGPAPGHAFYHYIRVTVSTAGIRTEAVPLTRSDSDPETTSPRP